MKRETTKLRFLKSVSLADQKVRHPNLGFWSQCHLLIKRQRHPDEKADTPKLRFLKSVSLADQKVETPWSKGEIKSHPNLGFWSHCHLLIKRWRQPTSESWNLGFWSQCHLLIKRWRHPDQKAETPKGRDTLIKRCRHPNLGFWSQCHLLIKWWRQLPLVKVGT